jgi:hypothetical protein
MLSICPGVIHYSTEIRDFEARQFHPHKWLKPGMSKKQGFDPVCFVDISTYSYAKPSDVYHKFSLGYGSWPGEYVARIFMYKFLATPVKNYDVRQDDPEQEWPNEPGLIISPKECPVKISRN